MCVIVELCRMSVPHFPILAHLAAFLTTSSFNPGQDGSWAFIDLAAAAVLRHVKDEEGTGLLLFLLYL